jgi:hypothetical protein
MTLRRIHDGSTLGGFELARADTVAYVTSGVLPSLSIEELVQEAQKLLVVQDS